MKCFVFSLSALALAAGLPALAEPAATAPAKRPNIVYILADDLGYGEVGCYGQQKIRTPHIDQLAKEGVRFTHAYTGAPVCAPSRCVLLTGRELANAAVRGNRDPNPKEEGQTPLPAGTPTLASQLKAAGYATAAFGKWGVGSYADSGNPNTCGFDHFFGYIDQRIAHSFYPTHLWSDGEKVMLDNGPKGIPGHGKLADASADFAQFQGKDHASERVRADLKAWLAARKGKEQPFFLYLPFLEPHLALQPPQKWVDAYPAAWDTQPYLGGKGYVPHPRPHAAYAGTISYLDEHVGLVLAQLKELGMQDDTLVIFTSDNGPTHDVGGVDTLFFGSAGPLRGRKGSLHEGGIRVPFIVRWPGHTHAGTQEGAMVAAVDMMATLCEAGGAKTPATEGVSVLPLFEGKALPAARPPIAWDFPEYGGQQMIVMENWKLIRTGLQNKQNKITPWQLYDLAADIGETKDLAAEQPERVKAMTAEFARRRTANPLFPNGSVDGAGKPVKKGGAGR